jgi:hypothetical protein
MHRANQYTVGVQYNSRQQLILKEASWLTLIIVSGSLTIDGVQQTGDRIHHHAYLWVLRHVI